MGLNLISFLALLLTVVTAYSQNNDRVVKADGDTITCDISHRFPSTGLKYRVSKNDKSIIITTDSIKAYYLSGENTWYRRVFYHYDFFYDHKNRVNFMAVVESGKIDLYEMIVYSNGKSTTEWFVSKGTDRAVMLKGDLFGKGKRQKEFTDLISDDQTVYDKFMADDSFGFEEIQKIVHFYNTFNTGKPDKEH